jgi:hypothetical protein
MLKENLIDKTKCSIGEKFSDTRKVFTQLQSKLLAICNIYVLICIYTKRNETTAIKLKKILKYVLC